MQVEENKTLALIALQQVKLDAISKGYEQPRLVRVKSATGRGSYIELVGDMHGKTRLLRWAVSLDTAEALGISVDAEITA